MTGPPATRVSDHTLRRLSWVVPVLLAAVYAVSVPILLAGPTQQGGTWEGGGALTGVLFPAVVLTFPLTGLLIVRRQPRNTVGWVLQGVGAAWGLTALTDAYAAYGLAVRPGSVPGAQVAAALSSSGWAPGIGLMGTFLLLLYPDGHLPSPRWRPLAVLSVVTITVVTVTITLSPGPLRVGPEPGLRNPLGLESLRTELLAVLAVALPLFVLCILASAAGLVRRFRRSHGVERLQLKWLATAGAAVAMLYLCGMAASLSRISLSSDQGDPGWLIMLHNASVLSFVLLPLSIGVAMLRHRLYDIDLVINRALVYGALTAALAAVYLASVLVLQLMLFGLGSNTVEDSGPTTGTARDLEKVGDRVPGPLIGQSDLAVAVSTLAAAAIFRPAKARIQAVVDRRFFRHRYDAVRTLDDFTARLRHEVDLEAVSADLTTVVRDTVAPVHASVWLRP